MNITEEKLNWAGSFAPRTATDYIVLHHADCSKCTVKDVHSWHLNNGWIGIGYHFFVSKEGLIYRGRPESSMGAHVEGYNSRSIGICAEGDYEKDIMPVAQQTSLKLLIQELKKKYPKAEIVGHKDLKPTLCPGKNYPLYALKNNQEVKAVQSWNPAGEIQKLLTDKVINTPRTPETPVTWGEFATVINRLRSDDDGK